MNTLNEHDWIANPSCDSPGETEQRLIDRRSDLIVVGEVQDAEADYSFDDYALVILDGEFYLLNTSGCSCPSPAEEWAVVFGPCSLAEMRKHLQDEAGDKGYGVTKRQHEDFKALCDAAEILVNREGAKR